MRVVLDTNILVSALWSVDGNPAKIVRLIPDEQIIPCYCDAILHEYFSVLSRPKFCFPQHQIIGLTNYIRHFGNSVSFVPSTVSLPDESDRVFYDAARAGNAILITGNSKHFPSEDFIMTPTEVLAALAQK